MGEELQTEFKTEGVPVFEKENKENDNSSDSSTDQTDGDQTQSQEGDQNSGDKNEDGTDKKDDAGFADHPRWKEREQDWTNRFNQQEQRHVDELSKLRQEFDQRFETIAPKGKVASEVPDEIPSWFGGDEEAWKQFQEWNESLVNKTKEATLNEIKSKGEAEQKAVEQATTFFNSEVTAIETDRTINPEGIKVDRNKLLKIVLDNDLIDSQGRWNYRAGFALLKAGVVPKTNNIDEKKKIAGASMSNNRAETKPQPFATSQDFEKPGGRPW